MNTSSLSESVQRIAKRVDQWHSSLALFAEQSALEPELEWSRLWLSWRTASELHEELSLINLKSQERFTARQRQDASRWWESPKKPNTGALSARWTGGYVWDASSVETSSAEAERSNEPAQTGPQVDPQIGLQSDPQEPRGDITSLHTQLTQVTTQLCRGEQQLRYLLLALPAHTIDSAKIHSRLDLISEALRDNNKNTQLSDLEEARRALRWVHESRLLKRLIAHSEERPGTFQEDLVSEVFSLGEVDWYTDALKLSQTTDQFKTTYRDGLEREVYVFERRVAQYLTQLETLNAQSAELERARHEEKARDKRDKQKRSKRSGKRGEGRERIQTRALEFKESESDLELERDDLLKAMWRCLLRGGELIVTIHVAPTKDADSLIERCRETRQELQNVIKTLVTKLTPERFSDLFTELSWELFYYSSDMMSEVDQTSLGCSVFRLESLIDDLNWYLAWEQTQVTDDAVYPDLNAALKRLEKQRHHVRVELQDKQLQVRLNSIFGARAVRYFEQLVFSLIWIVLGLIFYEFLAVDESDHQTRKVLALIDTGICFIFLLEFAVKIGLAESRWFYFKRRWFIDLLPSIPFVYFTDYLFLDMTSSGSSKLVQISRVARYLRIGRPFLRMLRLVSFSLRGVDRLVRRHSQWLDHNLVFFEPSQDLSTYKQTDELSYANHTYAESLALTRQLTAQLDTSELACLLPHYLQTLSAQFRGEEDNISVNFEVQQTHQRARDIPVEHAIDNLVHLQGAELESILGYRFPKRLYTLVGLFDLPFVNRVPILQWVFIKRRNSTASEFAAWWIRGFGKVLEFLMSVGYWFADLYGVVTGPKLIDRVGSTLVTSFERPAKRLLIFGGLLLTLQLSVSWLGFSVLSDAVTALQRFVGVPMIVIGSICFVPLLLGRWMKRIADQASEFYRFTSEAQFINLLKHMKDQQMDADLSMLYQRVIAPEERLQGLWETSEELKARQTLFVTAETHRVRAPFVSFEPDQARLGVAPTSAFSESQLDPERAPTNITPDDDRYWIDLHLHYLYRDYLDGALLHHTDIKTTEQLLGNLSMRNLLEYKINLTSSERRSLERLDLGSHRSIIGPYMWFSLITQSVSQGAAQLVIDYNRYAIPKHRRSYYSQESYEIFTQWLEHKQGGGINLGELEERKREQALFNSTDISVLQILAEKSSYEEEVRARFGDEVLSLLIKDQKKLIRGVFSSYPLYLLPKPIRTLNPYLLYNDFIQGGRLFWLPFRIIGLVFKGIGVILHWTKVKIDEIRFPDKVRAEVIPQKDFIVARRKIDRMRKPIFMKLLELRAQIDFAYLGLTLEELDTLEITSGDQATEESLVSQDLNAINALEVERVPIEELTATTQTSLREFYHYLEQRGLTGDRLSDWVTTYYPDLASRKAELLRAFMTAYLCDFKDLQSYLQTRDQLQEFITNSLAGHATHLRLHKKLLSSASRAASRVVQRGEDKERKGFILFWDHLQVSQSPDQSPGQSPDQSPDQSLDQSLDQSPDQSSDQSSDQSPDQSLKTPPIKPKNPTRIKNPHDARLKRCWEHYLSEGRDLNPLLTHFSERGLPDEDAIFHEVAQTLSMWTHELVSLRAVQTLALMDVNNYRGYIKTVGSYDEDERDA